MTNLQPIDVLNWIDSDWQWQSYFDQLIKPENWTQLHYGSRGQVGDKPLLSTMFDSKETIVSYFVKRIPANSYASAERAGKWIFYNLLNLNILNEFLLAAKDVKIPSEEEIFNTNVLGPKYQVGWISTGGDTINASFIFRGKGDGSRESRNQKRIMCDLTLLSFDQFYSAHAKNISDFSQLLIKIKYELQDGMRKIWQRTLNTTWKTILVDTRSLAPKR